MRRLVAFVSALSLLLSAEAAAQTNHRRCDAYIEMRDGVKLFTIIFEPLDGSGPHPIMIERTCYNAESKAYVKSDIRIHCGGKAASSIKLPAVSTNSTL